MDSPIPSKTDIKSPRGIQTRHIILLLCMLINIISYTTRMNINLTIVAMVKDEHKNQSQSDTCQTNNEYFSKQHFLGKIEL